MHGPGSPADSMHGPDLLPVGGIGPDSPAVYDDDVSGTHCEGDQEYFSEFNQLHETVIDLDSLEHDV